MKNKTFNAFTLAEVLITLAIIGVVAAITIPTLVQRYQERVTVTKLKKAYSLLNQAYQMAVLEHGTYDQWGMINAEYDEEGNLTDEFVNSFANTWNILAPYLNVAAQCTRDKEKCPGIFLEKSKLYFLDGRFRAEEAYNNVAALLLSDGIILTGGYTQGADCSMVRGTSKTLKNVCSDFQIRISGPRKAEYTVGKETFYFYITKYGIYPIGSPEDTYLTFKDTCKRAGTTNLNGYGCSAWVIMNGNMDYLHCDDLSWDGKKSCSDK